MQAPAILAASLVLAIGSAAGVTVLMNHNPDGPSLPDTGAADLKARVADLENQLQSLRSAGREAGESVQRQVVDPVSPAEIDAAVARWMARHPVEAVAQKNSASPVADLEQVFLRLSSGLSDSEMEAVWKELRDSGRVEEMVKKFERAAEASPNNPDAQVQLGVAYLMQIRGMTPGPETGAIALNADKTFDRALTLNPEHWDARLVKAQALSFWPPMFGKQAEAIDNLETLRKQQEVRSKQDPKYAQTYILLGNLYSQQGKSEKAQEAWSRGATLFPDHGGLREKIVGK